MKMRYWTIAIVSLLFISGTNAIAHDRLTAAEIQQMKLAGTYDERLGRILTLQQYKMSEALRARAVFKIRRAGLEARGLNDADVAHALTSGPQMAFPFARQPELKSTGTVKTVTILIDFKDRQAATDLPGMTVDGIRANIYGDGTLAAKAFAPYESLHAYYTRASEGKVNVLGDVLGWYHFPENRANYEPAKAPAGPNLQERQATLDNTAIFKMVSTALRDLDATNDFSQYDNDHDGDIDLVTIIYTGPDTGWGSFWWAYRWEFFIPEADADVNKFDGVRAKQFVFQFASRRGPGNTDFDPKTQLHEMGHAFGLADYYDYDDIVGPPGGVGGLDMMDSSWGNHNAFSRWLLDWIKPTTVGAGAPTLRQLLASGEPGNGTKAFAVFPSLVNASAPNQEMFVIENRTRMGNDAGAANEPGDGILVWHVDATVNSDGSDFLYNNSFTDRKLIRLMRADNPNDFGTSDLAGSGTYYVPGKSFTPTSSPNSGAYSGIPTGISLDGISMVGQTMSATLGFINNSVPQAPPQPTSTPPQDSSIPSVATMFSSAADRTYSIITGDAASAPIHMDEIENLNRIFSESKPSQLADIWAKTVGDKIKSDPLSSGKNTQPTLVMQSLLSAWAAKDGKSAVDALLKLPDGNFKTRVYPQLMATWAAQAPLKAVDWYFLDENKQLRADDKLRAGADFAHEAFEALIVAGRTDMIEKLDQLKHVPEVLGAIEGLHHGAAHMENGVATLRTNLNTITKNKTLVNAYLAIKDANDDIKDAQQRVEFQNFIKRIE